MCSILGIFFHITAYQPLILLLILKKCFMCIFHHYILAKKKLKQCSRIKKILFFFLFYFELLLPSQMQQTNDRHNGNFIAHQLQYKVKICGKYIQLYSSSIIVGYQLEQISKVKRDAVINDSSLQDLIQIMID